MLMLTRIGLVGITFAVLSGCSSEEEAPAPSPPAVTLAGTVGSSGGSVGTQSFGSVTTSAGGALRVSARELHVRGGTGRVVSVQTSANGAFRLDVARGSRWVVTVDDAENHSALVTFGDGTSAIAVKAGTDSATVDVGAVSIEGGEARASVRIDGRFGLEATELAVDEVFQAADGAILAAREAVALAHEAAEQARAAADRALDAAEEATRAAEAAAAAANEAQRP